MPFILIKINNVQKADLEGHEAVISEITYPGNQCAQAKKLQGVTYKGLPVYRVKTNVKERIVYTYLEYQGGKVLLILAYMADHNYDKLNRQLDGLESYTKLHQAQDDKEPYKKPAVVHNKDEKRAKVKHDYVSVTYYNKMHIALDVQQNKALQVALPLLLSGPPGSGKTGVVYTLLLQMLNTTATAAPETAAAPRAKSKYPIYFVSASQKLITTLENTHESLSNNAVNFTTWNALLLKHYPKYELVDEKAFAQWSLKLFPKKSAQTVHYELSLYAALGEDKYLKLKPRQSHFSGKKEQQKLIMALHDGWIKYLNDNKRIDPMVNMLPKKGKFIIYCDEAQNLPPIALRSLMEHTVGRNFVACLDSEQCLYASSFIANCLKELLHQHFNEYTEHLLARSWRCPPKVTVVTTHILNLKHKLDGFQDRRPYSFIESVQKEQGVASWVKASNYSKLQQYGALAGTVVIVIQKPDATERALINKELGSNNIITADEAIGLDFSTVILWKPVTATLREAITKNSVSEEQKRAFHALFVGCSRAQKALFVCDPRPELIPQLFGNTLESNVFDASAPDQKETPEQQKQQWEVQVQYYLDLKNYDQARQIMSFHLKLNVELIEKRIAAAQAPHTPPTPQDYKSPAPTSKGNITSLLAAKKTTALYTQNYVTSVGSGGSSQVVTKEKKTKISPTEYINTLLANPGSTNVEKFLQATDKQLERYLFEHQLSDKKNLFLRLSEHMAANTCLIANLKLDFLRRYITEKLLIKDKLDANDQYLIQWVAGTEGRMLTLLFEFSEGSCLFQRLVQRTETREILFGYCYTKSITKNLTKELLTDTPKGITRSVFYWMTATKIGRSFLLDLLYFNKHLLITSINAAILCQCYPDNDTPLFRLLTDVNGRDLLKVLFQNSAIIDGITSEALCLPITKALDEHGFVDSSSLLRFTASHDGLALFKTLIEKNEAIAKRITGEAFFRIPPQDIDKHSRTSPFFNLTIPQAINQELLKLLLSKNQRLLSEITAKILSLHLNQAGILENVTPFYLLSNTPEGISILYSILSTNPSLITEFSSDASHSSDLLLKECSDAMCTKSARDWLNESTLGKTILATYFPAVVNLPNIPQVFALKPSFVTAVGLFAPSAAAKDQQSAAPKITNDYKS